MLFISGVQHSARFSLSNSLVWSTKYLDGIVVAVVMMGQLLCPVFGWVMDNKGKGLITRTPLR